MSNASDQRSIDRKREKQKTDDRIRTIVLRTLLSNSNGRRYLWLELEACNVFAQTVVLDSGGFAKTAFNEGRRSLGLRLLADICRIGPEEYLKMTLENSGVEPEKTDERSTDDDYTSE